MYECVCVCAFVGLFLAIVSLSLCVFKSIRRLYCRAKVLVEKLTIALSLLYRYCIASTFNWNSVWYLH